MKRIIVGILGLIVVIGIYLGIQYQRSWDYKAVGVPVLNYHRIDTGIRHSLVVPPEEFKKQMQYLHDEGYHTITMDELYDYVTKGTELPDKPVLITFDDGYIDNYKYAFPILKEYNMKATLFMITSAFGESRFINVEQLKEMQANGIDIQSHTVNHKDLRNMSLDQARDELIGSKAVLEDRMKHPVRYIAYPGGFSNKDIDRIAEESGYRMAFTVQAGNVEPGQNLFNLPRQAVFFNDTPFQNFWVRLHYPWENAFMWRIHDKLLEWNLKGLADLEPLF